MRLSAISDVHVKAPHDEADKLLMRFLTHPLVASSEYVLLLGDIFDLMAGDHPEYLRLFSHIFDRLDELLKQGKKIYFSEGNHDVHLERLFLKRWPGRELVPSQKPFIEIIDGKIYYFSHGDEHEVDNLSYQRYMRFIQSPPLRFVANHVMPYRVLNFLGERASKGSRKKGSKIFNEEGVRERFRQGVAATTSGQYDFVIGGHSHVKDVYSFGKSKYVNNGYALRSKSFIHIDSHQIEFPEL